MSLTFAFEKESDSVKHLRLHSASPVDRNQQTLAQFQNFAGNQAIQSLFRCGHIQAKLTVGSGDDPAEREAEAVAAHVMSASETGEIPDGSNNEWSSIRRQPAQGTPPNISGIIEQILRSSGRPLDSPTRGFFERRFGNDFADVRVHTGPEAAVSARSIHAQAYTAGSDIVFASGQYAPATQTGRHLLAHELIHVIQQRSAPSDAKVRRQASPSEEQPESQTTYAAVGDEDVRVRVDTAVRELFKLRGPALASRNVKYLEQPQFAARLSARDLTDMLLYIFSFHGNLYPNSMPGQILDVYAGEILQPRPVYGYSVAKIRGVIEEGIRDGYFAYHSIPTIDEKGIQRITPADLVSMYVLGVTDISGPRAKRTVKIQSSGGTYDIAVLVHETCHFYVSDAFRDMVWARKDGDKYLGGALISKILLEGFAEFFAGKVMTAREEEFGSPSGAYPLEKEQAVRLAVTLGEDSVEAAYFGGNALQLKRLGIALDQYKLISPELLVPGSIVDSILSGAHAH